MTSCECSSYRLQVPRFQPKVGRTRPYPSVMKNNRIVKVFPSSKLDHSIPEFGNASEPFRSVILYEDTFFHQKFKLSHNLPCPHVVHLNRTYLGSALPLDQVVWCTKDLTLTLSVPFCSVILYEDRFFNQSSSCPIIFCVLIMSIWIVPISFIFSLVAHCHSNELSAVPRTCLFMIAATQSKNTSILRPLLQQHLTVHLSWHLTILLWKVLSGS